MFNPDTGFKPRAREGRDEEYKPLIAEVRVSIHAPAKGATWLYLYASTLEMFQSTRPRRARHMATVEWVNEFVVSIHAPAKGATRLGGKPKRRMGVSIHAPAKGATAFDLVKNEKA